MLLITFNVIVTDFELCWEHAQQLNVIRVSSQAGRLFSFTECGLFPSGHREALA
jgi:hypothetical protein